MPRRFEAGPIVAAAGAVLLLVSLFLDWYEPDLTAWTVFEVLDLVLAATALATLAAVLTRFGWGASAWDSRLPLLGVVALVIVGSQLLNHPPAAFDDAPDTGAWLGLAGAALMLAGDALTVARISLAVTYSPRAASPAARPRDEAAAAETVVQHDLYPEPGHGGPIGADDPETRA